MIFVVVVTALFLAAVITTFVAGPGRWIADRRLASMFLQSHSLRWIRRGEPADTGVDAGMNAARGSVA
jgi:hypothetical protein